VTPFAKKVAGIIALGVAIRLWVVFDTKGVEFDLRSYRLVFEALRAHHFDVYDAVQPRNWPYGPGYFPWVVVGGKLSRWFAFEESIRFGAVLADVGIIWLVQDLLGRFGATQRRRLLGASIIAFGPICIGVAGFNGQVDPAATLPALAALWVWTRDGPRRALWVGALIGIAGATKTVPLLLALPFAAAARSRRESAEVLVGAGVVFGALLLPFLVNSPDLIERVRDYHGLPAFGGLGLVLEPSFSANVLSNSPNTSDLDTLLSLATDVPKFVLFPALAGLIVVLSLRRPDALTGICLTYLVVYVFGVNFVVSYLIWSIPFFVVRGHLLAVTVMQLAMTPAMLSVFTAPVSHTFAAVFYTGAMIVAWLTALGVLSVLTYRIMRRERQSAVMAGP
jgi:hypothetical protein